MVDTGSPSTSSLTSWLLCLVPLCEGRRAVVLMVDTASPSTSSLTSWLLCLVPLREGWWVVLLNVRGASWRTQRHLVHLQRSASCHTLVPLREGQWVVLLKVRSASWRTQRHLVRLHQPPVAGPLCLSRKAGGWWSSGSAAPCAGRMRPCSTWR